MELNWRCVVADLRVLRGKTKTSVLFWQNNGVGKEKQRRCLFKSRLRLSEVKTKLV